MNFSNFFKAKQLIILYAIFFCKLNISKNISTLGIVKSYLVRILKHDQNFSYKTRKESKNISKSKVNKTNKNIAYIIYVLSTTSCKFYFYMFFS